VLCVLPRSYDNPEGTRGLVDSSGFRIRYTDKLRPNDMGGWGGPACYTSLPCAVT
jgi:hypothetical protein